MKKKTFIVLALVFVTLLIYYGYTRQSLPDKSKNTSKAVAADNNDIKTIAAGNTNFAFELYGKLINDTNIPNGNLFFSPYSISAALAMTYGGAKGETQRQMKSTLHFILPGERLHPTLGILQKQLIQKDKSSGYQLLLANALWGQKDEPFLRGFLALNKNYYEAGLKLLDFVNETEQSRQVINSWGEENTKDKIKNLIPSGGITPETVLVLTNAVYFKGQWQTKFAKKDTEQADFTISAKENIKVDMMYVKEKFRYYTDEKLQGLELPYRGNKISMLVLLPNDIEGLSEIENTISAERLNNLLSKMRRAKVEVYLPKFKITWGAFSLNKTLIKLGMPDVFDRDKADFSGINGKRNLYISDVFHKAFIEVNEEGTEAAAGTGVVMVKSIELPVVFRADHPFIFIIRDNRSGSILFIGRVMNPLEE